MKNKLKRTYTIEDRLRNANEDLKNLFIMLDSIIISLDNVHHYATGAYIGYKRIDNRSPFVEMHIRRRTNLLELHIRPVSHFFPDLNLYQVPDSHSWKLNTIKNVHINDDFNIIIGLCKKSYEEVYSTNN